MKQALVVAAMLLVAACSPPRLKLPTGPGVAMDAAEASGALAHATACAAVRTLTAEVAVSGSADGHRVRARLAVGMAMPASARIEAVAPFGPPIFIFVAVGDDATLLLPREGRVLEHGRPDAVLDAVAGIPIGARDLAAILAGCAPGDPRDAFPGARQFGDSWVVASGRDGNALYLHREASGGSWELAAVLHRSVPSSLRWRAEYADRQGAVPRSIRLTSVEDAGPAGRTFDLGLALSQVDTNMPLGADVFRVDVPAQATPTTLDELRRGGVVSGR
jgi:hypothetical protein